MKADPIISRPERQQPAQRIVFTFVTMVAWSLWVSLWLPLITLIAWMLGLQDVYVKLVLDRSFRTASDLGLVLQMAATAVLLLGGWAFYNHLRFAGKQKRRANRLIDISEMALALDASISTAQQLRARRRTVLHFSEQGDVYLSAE
ncbi:poly-beta-1,6-N-acetyl-D-glucosamine biosynthesis protein PgaD [Dyella mobilis]|uniref:Poly-beta-1,6-N-acetyl-D-glucosamine biosynthesis protein PgaD n=1 Tax=Dyella mobilis TaxID=1849582 RepID=A0ABS2KHX9_9GAMM|nr:poly-beta-1,6-N-acetyl-D-glucosamine biosynthesis protein PgaD [Dyella mobilis]MBM7130776.1 poly-beta-1,6-N-acetyl-D-glucosamine biosynthesis protein PgaD [Dyella mobilis]GLQ97402.1 hypothetical protein GCM10007863_18220 [Dyella mobilis]